MNTMFEETTTNPYAPRNSAKPVNFYCDAPSARSVYLVGDFNGWNATSHPSAAVWMAGGSSRCNSPTATTDIGSWWTTNRSWTRGAQALSATSATSGFLSWQ